MQKIIIGLAASALFAASASANTGDSWLQLDEEIASLNSTVTSDGGMGISGYIADWYTSNTDKTPNEGGWKFKSLRLTFKGKVEDMAVKVSYSLKSGTSADLKDAYVKWEVTDGLELEVGRFKRPFAWNYVTSSSRLLFYDNTMNGNNEDRDTGFMLSGNLGSDMFDWRASVTNGADDSINGPIDNKVRYTARVTANVAGEGAFRKHEGAVNSREELDASIGVSYSSDESVALGFEKVGVDGAMTVAGFFASFDVIDWNANGTSTVTDKDTGIDLDNTTPWSLTGSYLLREDMEFAVRYEDFNDTANTNRTTVGFNFYQILPHRAKWMINYSDLTSDTAALEQQIIRVGLVISY